MIEDFEVRRRGARVEVVKAPDEGQISEKLLIEADPRHLRQEGNRVFITDDFGFAAEYQITGINDFGRVVNVRRVES